MGAAMVGRLEGGGSLFCLGLQGVDATEEVGQALLQHRDAPFELVGDRRGAVEVAAGGHIADDARLPANLGALPDRQVPRHADLAREHDVVLHGGAARHASAFALLRGRFGAIFWSLSHHANFLKP